MVSSPSITPVIISGGVGTRLWPLSRQSTPKQFLPLTGEKTMLELTADRVRSGDLFTKPLVVGSHAHADLIEAQIGHEGLMGVLLEPVARNTAPAMALAALHAQPEDLLLVLPSDHLIKDVPGFLAAAERAAPHAQNGWIVTFGMKPVRPETGYGYIKRGAKLGDGVFRADHFVEKPEAETAETYVQSDNYDWNGGIFLFQAQTLLSELEAYVPSVLDSVRTALDKAERNGNRVHPDAEAFARAPSISIDYAVMERSQFVAVVPVSIDWSDIGSWSALYDALPQDSNGNAFGGDVIAIDTEGTLIRSSGPTVSVVGISDLVIIATPDVVLVVPRRDSQKVKKIVDALKARGDTKLL